MKECSLGALCLIRLHCWGRRCSGRAAGFEPERIVYDEGWDLFGYAGWSPRLRAMVVSFRGTDSHSIYNWAENMRYWRTDFNVPFPGSDGSLVHTGGWGWEFSPGCRGLESSG